MYTIESVSNNLDSMTYLLVGSLIKKIKKKSSLKHNHKNIVACDLLPIHAILTSKFTNIKLKLV